MLSEVHQHKIKKSSVSSGIRLSRHQEEIILKINDLEISKVDCTLINRDANSSTQLISQKQISFDEVTTRARALAFL